MDFGWMRHLIADLSFSRGYVTCTCQANVTGATPDELYIAFQDHRRDSGANRPEQRTLGPSEPDRWQNQMKTSWNKLRERPCQELGCPDLARAKGWCLKHYAQAKRRVA